MTVNHLRPQVQRTFNTSKLVKENCRLYLLLEAELNLAKLITAQIKYITTKRLPTLNMSIVLPRASFKLICDIFRILQVVGA